ncbi:hypothetical protein JOF55_004559 [Haloactinomyces albus]|uniref:Uncharacterized protein n=1 Tax=Haloactinomyces albus TaxID=1352928 RepID=A0AAE4CS71_9ACTN|nr:hypothetical protein [Haloactinomyces albus]
MTQHVRAKPSPSRDGLASIDKLDPLTRVRAVGGYLLNLRGVIREGKQRAQHCSVKLPTGTAADREPTVPG